MCRRIQIQIIVNTLQTLFTNPPSCHPVEGSGGAHEKWKKIGREGRR